MSQHNSIMALLCFLWKYHELFICLAFTEIHGKKKLISKIAQEAAADSILFASSPQPVPLRHHFPFLEMWPLIHPIYIFCLSGWFLVVLVPFHTLCVCCCPLETFQNLAISEEDRIKLCAKDTILRKVRKLLQKWIKWFLKLNYDCTFPGWVYS